MGNLTDTRKKSYRGEKTKDPEYKPDKNEETEDEMSK